MEWFRSYHGAPTDSKWVMIGRRANVAPGVVASVWWALMDFASQAEDRDEPRGSVRGFDPEELACFYGWATEDVEAVLTALTDKGLIDEGSLAAWEKRQPKREDNSTERVRRHRERKRTIPTPVTQGNARETRGNAPEVEVEKERETDTSVIQLIARSPEEDIDAIILAANRGMQDNPLIGDAYQPIPVSHGSRQDVGDWLRDGIPVNVARAACYQRAKEYRPDGRRNRITTMRYFTEAVGDAHDRHRAAQSEAPNVDHGTGSRGEVGRSPSAGRKPGKFDHLIETGDGGARQAG